MKPKACPEGTALDRRSFLELNSALGIAALGSFAGARAADPADDFVSMSVQTLASGIQARKFSSVEVVQAHLARIAEVNPSINAVPTIADERALREARQADDDLSSGRIRGPLHGVPMTIKDAFDTEAVVTTYGTLGKKSFAPRTDATVVSRLRRAGAILLGKSNTPEFTAMYDTRNPVFGITKNPYDLTKSPGGSSGGAAAIVAACGSPFDIGTDSGGSIRFPAGLCGIAGLKPTLGRVPQTGCIIRPGLGVIDECNHVGPMARFVEDLFPLLEVIAGPDGRDASVVPVELRRPTRVTDMQARQPLRVAFYTDNGFRAADADVKRTVESVASELVLAKLRVEEKRPEALARLPDLYLRVDLADGLDWFRVLMKQCNTAECDPDLAPYLNTKPMSGTDFAELIRNWHLFRTEMLTWMQDYDAVVCPVSTMSSLPSGFNLTDELGVAFYDLYAFNLVGWPVAVVRCGSSDDGMPIGVQIAANPWREDVCLAIAKHLETELGGWKRPAI